ncbi:MAG: hypothetical protein OXN91_01570 [Chloroflexota bacterium]|nr:hypothetical protein [Chloroflexota bacterium]
MERHAPTTSSTASLWRPLAGALLLTALLAIPSSTLVLAQDPVDAGLTLVNDDRDPIERKDDGRFIARPLFNQAVDGLHYGVRHPDTGAWITSVYQVHGGATRRADGWEYSFEYPGLDEQPDLDPDQTYLLVLLVAGGGGTPHTFHTVIPVYQPTGLWDQVLSALDPERWARAFAHWVIEGVHGTLCGVVERASDADAAVCGGG